NVSELPYLFDGSPKTSWMSDVYFGPRFGGSGGFGLAIELGAPHIVHRLSVATSMQDWSADTFVANSYAGRLSGWGGPTDSRSGIGGDTTFTLGAKSCDWVLLWLIDPGPTHQAEVQELTVS
ncbi:MAG TPA: hypothetical protein VED59_04470, partial [Acidimicrobiales bacterium]|nr:hypothetical protein [Acidimicrobiales bacterium]